jgi:hypothetical protein
MANPHTHFMKWIRSSNSGGASPHFPQRQIPQTLAIDWPITDDRYDDVQARIDRPLPSITGDAGDVGRRNDINRAILLQHRHPLTNIFVRDTMLWVNPETLNFDH